MRSVLFLSDTVNRRFLQIYNESGMFLPNLDRLVRRSVTFCNHFTGSAPCMPARRDIMTGRLNFLERNWGPIEAFDQTLPQILRDNGVCSHMVTDHYHYLEIGGENYCQMFDSWEMVRGQEWDPVVSRIQNKEIPCHYGKIVPQYWYNRDLFKDDEKKFPSPTTIEKAACWLEENHDQDDFLLWVEPFDPHEPFEVPEEYLKKVGDTYEGKLYLWPEYKKVEDAELTEEALQHIRRRYLALLLMTDEWLGHIFDVMDAHDMWKDTLFIFTTDHGYMLGEHGYMAKNYMPAYNEVFHIPLIVHLPGDEGAGKRIDAITQNIDILPTLMEFYQIPACACRNKIHGKSWMPLIREEVDKLRECALYGYYGKQINLTDGRYTYFKAPNEENRPLYLYTSVPTDIRAYFDADRLNDFSRIEAGAFLSWTEYPVYRIPADIINDNNDATLRFIYLQDWEKENQIYDLQTDYEQKSNIYDDDPEITRRLDKMMERALREHDAPEEQLIRLRFQ